jgi:hypothetical protein
MPLCCSLNLYAANCMLLTKAVCLGGAQDALAADLEVESCARPCHTLTCAGLSTP